jgi:hypothetical protein
MIKFLIVGVWVCAVTLGSVYFGMNWKQAQPTEAHPEKLTGGAETVRTKMLTVPVISDGAIQGYVIAQFAFVMDAKLLKRMTVQPEVFLLDEAYSTIYTSGMIDFRNPAKHDIQALAKTIADKVNKRLGGKYVEDVLIQELNFFSKEDVRSSPNTSKDKASGKDKGGKKSKPQTEH